MCLWNIMRPTNKKPTGLNSHLSIITHTGTCQEVSYLHLNCIMESKGQEILNVGHLFWFPSPNFTIETIKSIISVHSILFLNVHRYSHSLTTERKIEFWILDPLPTRTPFPGHKLNQKFWLTTVCSYFRPV